MTPLVAIAGRSGSGKTTLVTALLRCFARQGLRVATVKDCHGKAVLDTPGKDTDRHRRAGACAVLLRAPAAGRLFFPVAPDEPLSSLVDRWMDGCDAVLAEGFKAEDVDKVEVARSTVSRELLLAGDPRLRAVASDFPVDAGVPWFALDDAAGLARFLADEVLRLPATHGGAP